MVYMRIDRNKFWGWVVVSLTLGLIVGLIAMFFIRGSSASKVTQLEQQLAAQSAESSSTISTLQLSLQSAEASVTELTARNSQLTSDLAAANAKVTAAKKSTTTTTTAISFVSRSVSPTSVEASHTLTLTVKIDGHADKVRMQIVGGTYDQTFYLSRVSTSGGVETWRRSVKAPPKKGTYHYYAGAFVGTTKKTMPGVSAWTFEVK
jgi:hypothetical protein